MVHIYVYCILNNMKYYSSIVSFELSFYFIISNIDGSLVFVLVSFIVVLITFLCFLQQVDGCCISMVQLPPVSPTGASALLLLEKL